MCLLLLKMLLIALLFLECLVKVENRLLNLDFSLSLFLLLVKFPHLVVMIILISCYLIRIGRASRLLLPSAFRSLVISRVLVLLCLHVLRSASLLIPVILVMTDLTVILHVTVALLAMVLVIVRFAHYFSLLKCLPPF